MLCQTYAEWPTWRRTWPRGARRSAREIVLSRTPRSPRATCPEVVRDWVGRVVDGTTRAQHPQGLPEVLAAHDPGVAAAGGVAVRLGHRPAGIPGVAPAAPGVPAGGRAWAGGPGLPVGRPGGEPGAGRQPYLVAHARLAAGRRRRSPGPGDVRGVRSPPSGRGLEPGPGLPGAGEPFRGPSPAGALAVPRAVPGAVLHGAAPAYLAVPGTAFRHRRAAGPGEAVHLPAGRTGRFRQLDSPRGPDPQGRLAALPGRRRPMDRTAHRIRPVPGPYDAVLDDLGRPGRDDRGAGGHGLLPDGARRPLPHRIPAPLSGPQGRPRERRDRPMGPELPRDPGRSGSPLPHQQQRLFLLGRVGGPRGVNGGAEERAHDPR